MTSGNSQTVIFNNIFINPPSSVLTFTTIINSELGDVDTQTFSFNITCLCVPTTSTSTVVECDSYTWNGTTTYTSSGTYTYITTNLQRGVIVHGKYNYTTLNLTINSSSTITHQQ